MGKSKRNGGTDRFSHSFAATQKGGRDKSGRGGWGDAETEIHHYENMRNEDLEEESQYEQVTAAEPFELDDLYELRVWNIPSPEGADQLIPMLTKFPGYQQHTVQKRGRSMLVYFDSQESADGALVLNNTKLGDKFIGIRYSNKLSEQLLQEEQEYDTVETDGVESDAEETNAKETEAVETNAEETDAVETDAVETNAEETGL